MKTSLLLFLVTLLAIPLTAQQSPDNASTVIARISYNSTYGMETDSDSSRICFALDDTGHYRLSRVTRDGRQTVQGYLSEVQFKEMRKMLSEVNFTSNKVGLARVGAESFVAEIGRDDRTARFAWVDADHTQPLPNSAAVLVDWLQMFKATGSSPLHVYELSSDPICPAASVQPAPAMAELSDAPGCGRKP